MKEIKYASHFARNYKQRIARDKQLVRDFRDSVDAFLEDRSLVDDHPLEDAMHGKRSFSVDSEYRVIYIERDEYYLFLDIGTHEQVYRR